MAPGIRRKAPFTSYPPPCVRHHHPPCIYYHHPLSYRHPPCVCSCAFAASQRAPCLTFVASATVTACCLILAGLNNSFSVLPLFSCTVRFEFELLLFLVWSRYCDFVWLLWKGARQLVLSLLGGVACKIGKKCSAKTVLSLFLWFPCQPTVQRQVPHNGHKFRGWNARRRQIPYPVFSSNFALD